jgi:glycosyltransferase involved in cell wall biosynthesis
MDAGPDHSRSPKNIVMHEPFVAFDELPIDRADAWLFTSAWEGMPNLLLEVGIRGFPVVASAVGGVPELISRETGWPVQPEAPAADYASALAALLADPAEALRRGERLASAVAGGHTREGFDASLDSVFGREPA